MELVLLTLFTQVTLTINTSVTCTQIKSFFVLKLFELINLNGLRQLVSSNSLSWTNSSYSVLLHPTGATKTKAFPRLTWMHGSLWRLAADGLQWWMLCFSPGLRTLQTNRREGVGWQSWRTTVSKYWTKITYDMPCGMLQHPALLPEGSAVSYMSLLRWNPQPPSDLTN